MSELTYDPINTIENALSTDDERPPASTGPDPRLVSAARVLLRWMLESAQTAPVLQASGQQSSDAARSAHDVSA